MVSSHETSSGRSYFNTGQRPPPPPPPTSPKWDAEGLARCLTNFTIVAGVVTCLSLAVAAVRQVDSESTVVILLLVPTFFGGACLLTLVNVSWMSRRPGKRCSFVQLICNLVLILMTLYVELLFWRYRRALALAILCAAAIPMLVFINMPSLFMIPEFLPGEADTVVMEDDDHSLFNVELSDVEGQQQPVEEEESAGEHSTGHVSPRQSTENLSSGEDTNTNESSDQRNWEGEERTG